MRKEAEINWEWLETERGKIWLKKLNSAVKELEENKLLEERIFNDCPFSHECEKACEKAFLNGGKNCCPCYTFKASFELAIILSDYWDMINEEI